MVFSYAHIVMHQNQPEFMDEHIWVFCLTEVFWFYVLSVLSSATCFLLSAFCFLILS